ncbi:MAG: SUMF1/EgtB/PvdO family nonheme iron enzyme [Candidatus Cloacimonetes bacterium]|nr:SUMF1/EgtB/PvdO family nonheme iron enzyme [Candidatus Cloacimonadota bacterium]
MKLTYILNILIAFFLLRVSYAEEIFFDQGNVFNQGKHVAVKAFFLDEFEVSNKDYSTFLNLSKFKSPTYMYVDGYNQDDQAVVGIDWYEANLYCRYNGKRLPSYLEYIYASQGQEVQSFPFGNEFPAYEKAPFVTQAYRPKFPLKVHEFKDLSSLNGVLNLAGNAAEWTFDWVSDKRKKLKKVYGGSYISDIDEIRVGSFKGVPPNENTLKTVGFRCARTHSDEIVISSIKQMAPEDLKALAFKDNISNNDFIKIKKKSVVKNIKVREKKRDEEKQKLYLKKLLLMEIEKRQKLVSTPMISSVSGMIHIPYGMFLFSANSEARLDKSNLTYLDAYQIDKNLVTIQEVISIFKSNSIDLLIPFSRKELKNTSQAARLSFDEAREYCEAIQKDLPTEAQWERSIKANRFSNDYDKKGELRGSFGILFKENTTEWMKDYLGTYSKDKEGFKNPSIAEGLFRYTKGPSSISDYKSKVSRKVTAMPWTRANFRCVKESSIGPPFKIDLVDNYYFKEYFQSLRVKIEKGQNVFNLNPSSSEFEDKIEELDQELE